MRSSAVARWSAAVGAFAFSPDGQTILTGDLDNTARLGDLRTGKRLGSVIGHTNSVLDGVFSPDGRSFHTYDDGHVLHTWPLAAPLEADTDRLVTWAQVVTGMQLTDRDEFRPLDAKTWQERRKALSAMPGPALP